MFDWAADSSAVYRRIGSATLFDGAWRLLPVAERRQVFDRDGTADQHAHRTRRRPDIGADRRLRAQTFHWVVCRVEDGRQMRLPAYRLADDPADIPVFGTSLAMLLDAALDSGGDIAHLETGSARRPPPRLRIRFVRAPADRWPGHRNRVIVMSVAPSRAMAT